MPLEASGKERLNNKVNDRRVGQFGSLLNTESEQSPRNKDAPYIVMLEKYQVYEEACLRVGRPFPCHHSKGRPSSETNPSLLRNRQQTLVYLSEIHRGGLIHLIVFLLFRSRGRWNKMRAREVSARWVGKKERFRVDHSMRRLLIRGTDPVERITRYKRNHGMDLLIDSGEKA